MKVIATVRVMVPKRSAISVRVSITAAGGNNTMMRLRPSVKLLEKSKLSAGKALIDCLKKDSVVHVMNVDHAGHVIVERTSIGHLVPIEQTSNLSLEVGGKRNATGEMFGLSGKLHEPAVFEQCVASTLVVHDRSDLIELLMGFRMCLPRAVIVLTSPACLNMLSKRKRWPRLNVCRGGGHGRSRSLKG